MCVAVENSLYAAYYTLRVDMIFHLKESVVNIQGGTLYSDILQYCSHMHLRLISIVNKMYLTCQVWSKHKF